MYIVKVLSTKITDGIRSIKFLKSGRKDIRETQAVAPFGLDSNPIDEMVAIYAQTQHDGDDYIIGYLLKNQISKVGESRLYSTDEDGVEQISLHMKNDGTAEFGGNSDFMVRYSELENAFNELRDSHNSLVNKWNTFALAYVPGGPSVVGLPPTASTASQSSADISGAKIQEIKTS